MLAQEKEVGIAKLDPTITSRVFEGSIVITALPVCIYVCVGRCGYAFVCVCVWVSMCVCVGGCGCPYVAL